MKARFSKSELLEAVGPAAAIAAIRHVESNIEGILLECPSPEDEASCRVTAYDMEKGMRTSVPCEVIEEGTILINAQNLQLILRSMTTDEIEIRTDEKQTKATIVSGKSRFTIGIQSGERFPSLPLLSGDKNYDVPQHILRDVVMRTIYAVNENEQRPAFTGLLFRMEGSTMRCVGCDGNRIAIAHAELPAEGDKASVIVPKKLLLEVMKMVKDSEDTIHVAMTMKHIIFTIGKFIYFTRLVDGEYLDYARILPKETATSVLCGVTDLRTALERATLVTEDKFGGNTKPFVKLDFKDDGLHISSVSAGGSIEEDVPIRKQGPDLEIGFNCRYLIEALRNVPDSADALKLGLNSAVQGVTIERASGSGTKSYITLEPIDKDEEDVFLDYVMPVRMNR